MSPSAENFQMIRPKDDSNRSNPLLHPILHAYAHENHRQTSEHAEPSIEDTERDYQDGSMLSYLYLVRKSILETTQPTPISSEPPFLSILTTILHKFYLEGKSTSQISNDFLARWISVTPSFIQRVVGTTTAFPARLINMSEARAKERINQRTQMLEFILHLSRKGHGNREIQGFCWFNGYLIDEEFVRDFISTEWIYSSESPFLGILISILHKFFLEEKSATQISNDFLAQQIFFPPSLVQRVAGATTPFPARLVNMSEARAKERINQRTQMLEFILHLSRKGYGSKEVQGFCWFNGYLISEEFVRDLITTEWIYYGQMGVWFADHLEKDRESI